MLTGRRVMAEDFGLPWFKERTEELNQELRINRKLWEWVSIVQAHRDLVLPYDSAIGFGVGQEPIPAWLAARGVRVLATDRPDPGTWNSKIPGAGHASGKDQILCEGICQRQVFNTNVTYRPVDMVAIPEDLHGKFDFSWSSSCFEHLGSIQAGLNFFCEQMKCLRPGGIAAHTTEYNFLSNYQTLEAHDLVAFRQRDFTDLKKQLKDQGDILFPLDLLGGKEEADLFVDEAPYQEEPHLAIKLAGHSFTSVLLVASRG
jgi:SAM-dependent methyltransferase